MNDFALAFLLERQKRPVKKLLAMDFIKNHKHINYCECIIYPNGMISYAEPSHVEALINEFGMDREKLWEVMPITASPIVWLIDHTKCVAVWNDFSYVPAAINAEQKRSLQLLINHGLVKDCLQIIREGAM